MYVDDFAITGHDKAIEAVAAAVKAKWRITEQPTVKFGSWQSTQYLSVDIVAEATGFFLSQAVYTRDLLEKWGMSECRALAHLKTYLKVPSPRRSRARRRSARPSALQAASTGWQRGHVQTLLRSTCHNSPAPPPAARTGPPA